MGQQVPAASTVAVVVEPGAEDEVGGDGEEDTGRISNRILNDRFLRVAQAASSMDSLRLSLVVLT